MAAIAFDPLEYTHELEASGVPREQAEVHAKAMTARFIHNFDALVTRDYLDTRFTEFETRIEATMDRRFGEVDKRFSEMDVNMDSRIAEVNRRFTEMGANMNSRFAQVDVRFERMEGKFLLVYWMQGLTIACVVIPVIRDFLA